MTEIEPKRRRRRHMRSLTKFIIFSFAALIAYTIISQLIAVRSGAQLDTLTTCFFSAFGGEVLACALIKIFKLKNGEGGQK